MKGLLLSLLAVGNGQNCPMFDFGTPPTDSAEIPTNEIYADALQTLDIKALEKDLVTVMNENQECWPQDTVGHYGPFFIRLAWHCAGTYRDTDKRGGCEGGRQRFSPERDWPDNANLQHARALLAPLKQKYGHALSWGDLFTYAGTVAIRDMGGPYIQHCFGRTDEVDGTRSHVLGFPENYSDVGCEVQGNCSAPLGAIFVGLIYVNPEGPLVDENNASSGADPDPVRHAPQIRDVFGRMGWNDSETAALITGGHVFGGCHGACMEPPCSTSPTSPVGKGPQNIFTSGFEGDWTTTPFSWEGAGQLVSASLDQDWSQHLSPAGRVQWRTTDQNVSNLLKNVIRLTADLALVADPIYKAELMKYQADVTVLERNFAAAWSRLVLQGALWAQGKKCEPESPEEPTQPPDSRAGQATWSFLNAVAMVLVLPCGLLRL